MLDKTRNRNCSLGGGWHLCVPKILWIILPAVLFLWYPAEAGAQQITLDNLNSFTLPADGWKIQGEVAANPLEAGSFKTREGTGLLVGSANAKGGSTQIATKRAYGNMAVEFDVLLSHGVSAIVFLQGRYGLRLVDSWKDKKVRLSGNGSIIPPPNKKGGSPMGYLPSENVARAPGTWQHIRVVFEAPQFDSDGTKSRSARLVSVEQNGMVIQENQYLPVSSRGAIFTKEQTEGLLAFQINKGHVAIKNLTVTKYSDQQVQLEELHYKMYQDQFLDDEFVYWGGDKGGQITLPDLLERESDDNGKIKQIHTRMVRGKDNDFALAFNGKLNVPRSGEYRFEIIPHGIGSFELDGEEQVRWNALHNKGNTAFSVELQKGSHSFRQLYVNYGQPKAGLFVEGPGIRRQALHEGGQIPEGSTVEPILLTPGNGPLIQRSFLYQGEQKLLTCLNVGSPDGVHYTVNMATGGLVQAWRGKFGDVTQMWHGRGVGQVLQPLGSVLSFDAQQQVLLDKHLPASNTGSGTFKREGYDLNTRGEPIFQYTVGPVKVRDHIHISNRHKTLKRTLRFTTRGGNGQTVWYHMATAPTIEQVADGLYAIDDKTYFIEIDKHKNPEIHQKGNQQVLLVPLQVKSESEHLTYSIIW